VKNAPGLATVRLIALRPTEKSRRTAAAIAYMLG
jgi:hypothetical protein